MPQHCISSEVGIFTDGDWWSLNNHCMRGRLAEVWDNESGGGGMRGRGTRLTEASLLFAHCVHWVVAWSVGSFDMYYWNLRFRFIVDDYILMKSDRVRLLIIITEVIYHVYIKLNNSSPVSDQWKIIALKVKNCSMNGDDCGDGSFCPLIQSVKSVHLQTFLSPMFRATAEVTEVYWSVWPI